MGVLREKIKLPKREVHKGIVRVYRLRVRWVGGQRSAILREELREKLKVDDGDYLLVSETKEGVFYLEKEERD